MKKIITIFIVSFSLMSCSISEQIIFNEDGTGKLAYTVDMSKMLEVAANLDKDNAKKMSKGLMDDTEKDMDSLLYFKDIPAKYKKEGKELTPEQLANLEKMKDFSMRIVMNKAKNEAKYIMYTDFKKIGDIQNLGSMMSALQTASGKNTETLGVQSAGSDSDVQFTLNTKKFTRVVVEKPIVEELEEVYEYETVDSVEYENIGEDAIEELKDTTIVYDDFEEMESEESESEDVEVSKAEIKKMNAEFKKMGEMMEKGLKESYYNFQYTFPKKIKKVSLPKSSYKLSEDKKTIFIKYQFEEFTKKVKNLNLDIELE